MKTKNYYICSNCGFSEFNRCDWCDLGCGEDFNEMIEIKGLGDFLSKVLDEQREEIIEKIKEKERVYEEEVKENNIEPASIEGEFHEQFLDGYNQALDDIIKEL